MLKVSGELELTAIEQINAEHHACEAAVRSALKHAVRCGALLEEQKATVNHGGWQRWLEENFTGSVKAAQAQRTAHLSIDGALKALSAPKDESPDLQTASPDELEARAEAAYEQ